MQLFTYHHVLTLISDFTGLVDIQAQQPRLKRLIEKACVEVRNPNHTLQLKRTIPVHNGIAKLPCLSYRVMRVMDMNDHSIDYSHTPEAIYPKKMREGAIKVIYQAFPSVLDEDTNKPCLLINHEQLDYCAWYAITNVLRDDKAETNMFQQWLELMDVALLRAKGTWRSMSMDDIEETLNILITSGFRMARL